MGPEVHEGGEDLPGPRGMWGGPTQEGYEGGDRGHQRSESWQRKRTSMATPIS